MRAPNSGRRYEVAALGCDTPPGSAAVSAGACGAGITMVSTVGCISNAKLTT